MTLGGAIVLATALDEGGFDSIEVTPPLVRQEIYQLWYLQSFFEDRLSVRIGKSIPTYDFGNVVRPVPVRDSAAAIPAVSGLIYTPIFVNPTMLGVIPGYYNSAVGLTVTVTPNDRTYLSYGIYDGTGAGVDPRVRTLSGATGDLDTSPGSGYGKKPAHPEVDRLSAANQQWPRA